MGALYLLGTLQFALALTYLLTQLTRAYKAGNISETVKHRAKVTINGRYEVVHGLRLPPKCMTLNDLCARFKVIYSLNVAKMSKYSLVMTPTPYVESFAFGKP